MGFGVDWKQGAQNIWRFIMIFPTKLAIWEVNHICINPFILKMAIYLLYHWVSEPALRITTLPLIRRGSSAMQNVLRCVELIETQKSPAFGYHPSWWYQDASQPSQLDISTSFLAAVPLQLWLQWGYCYNSGMFQRRRIWALTQGFRKDVW